MKIYTKTGDRGETSIIGGKRLPKYHPRIEAYGTLDELIAWIGLLRGAGQHCVSTEELIAIQSALMTCCSVVATDPSAKVPVNIKSSETSMLERSIDAMESRLPALNSFILPGGHPHTANCNIARCVCRRAERALLRLDREEKVDQEIIRYINRLSDYLFVLTRCLSYDADIEEVKWLPDNKAK
jgi:cob(I)alamin adenosyltransferase